MFAWNVSEVCFRNVVARFQQGFYVLEEWVCECKVWTEIFSTSYCCPMSPDHEGQSLPVGEGSLKQIKSKIRHFSSCFAKNCSVSFYIVNVVLLFVRYASLYRLFLVGIVKGYVFNPKGWLTFLWHCCCYTAEAKALSNMMWK